MDIERYIKRRVAELTSPVNFQYGYETWEGAEGADVTIRCYLLSECIETVLDELIK